MADRRSRSPGSAAASPLTGIALMAAASLAVPVVDAMAKHLGETYSPFFVAWLRYLASTLVILPIVFRVAPTFIRKDFNIAANLARTVLIVASMTCFFFSITMIPLATAFGGYFLGPVIAAILSMIFLAERLTARRALAVTLGLTGAYLIVKPGFAMEPGAVLAVVSGALFAGYLVTTRLTATTTPPVHALVFQVAAGTVLLTPFAVAHFAMPSGADLLVVAGIGIVSVTCHFLVIVAFRHAEASVLSPFAYLELVTAVILGYLIFHELPDLLSFAGILLIVGAGLVTTAARSAGR